MSPNSLHQDKYKQMMDLDADRGGFLRILPPLFLSLRLIHKDTKMALFKFKGRGQARRVASLHRRTAETTDGHSSEGLLPHIRLSSSDPPIPRSSHPPICI